MNIGLLIQGVGNGHITQANTIYDILIKNGYLIPIVILYGPKNKNLNFINNQSKIIYKKQIIDEELQANSESLKTLFLSLYEVFKSKEYIYLYEKKYNLNLWINFFAPVFFTKIPMLVISSQFNIEDYKISFLHKVTLLNKQSYGLLHKAVYAPPPPPWDIIS